MQGSLLINFVGMKITVLVENSVCKINTKHVKSEDGLSLYIELEEQKIVFDSGQSDLFIHNAVKMGIDLTLVDYLVISHGHFEQGGGLNHFLKINKKAKIFLHIKAAYKYYTSIFGFIPYNEGLENNIPQNNRINFIKEDTQIDDKIILLEGFPEVFDQPGEDKEIFEKTNNPVSDKFNHQLAMMLIENDEIVLFSGCSHSGIINIIEEVKLFSKTMRIKATFGNKILTLKTGEIIEI